VNIRPPSATLHLCQQVRVGWVQLRSESQAAVEMFSLGLPSARIAALLLWLGPRALVVEGVRPEPSALEGNPALLQSAEVDSKGMSTFPVLPSSELALAEEQDLAAGEEALSCMHAHLEKLGLLTAHSFQEDIELLNNASGNLSAMGDSGRHLVRVLETSQAAWATLKPEEASYVTSLLARDQFRKPAQDEDFEDGAPPELKQEDTGMSSYAWKAYTGILKVFDKLKGTRRNVNAVVSFVSMMNPDLVKDSIVLKLLFLLYTDPIEDDYPYVPRNVGGFDTFLETMAGNSPRVQPSSWLALLSVGYTFSWLYSCRC